MDKKKLINNIVVFGFIFFPMNVFAVTDKPDFIFCRDGVLETFKLLSILISIIKVLIPLLLIIFGCIDIGKAVIADDNSALKKSANIFVKRLVAGIVIFFIPTIMNFVFNLVYNIDDQDTANDLQKCTNCLLDIDNCK